MRKIVVFSKKIAFYVLVDDDDYSLLSRHKWYILFAGKKKRPYAFTRFYTENDKKNGKTFLMHHMIMGTSRSVDHIDNDSLNNRKKNLRPATYQQNGWNRGKNSRAAGGRLPTSKYKGVSKCIRANGTPYWRVIIKTTKKGVTPERFIRLNGFKTERDAALAYNKEIAKLRVGWAWLNPISREKGQRA